MTVDEAIEKYKLDKRVGVRVCDGKSRDAIEILAREYVNLTDPTQLTLDLVKREIGDPQYSNNQWSKWCFCAVWMYFEHNDTHLKFIDIPLQVSTLGDLRWIASNLRKVSKP
jgi:hypothetical protein